VIEQLPAATLAVHEPAAPALTVTLPVGVPLPGEVGVTLKLIVTASPATEGLGEWLVMLVVVAALFTVCATPAEVLPANR
jgi:hypothetical protein